MILNFTLSCIATILGIVGATLNIYKFKWSFLVWNLGNLILIYKAIEIKDYPNLVLFIFYFSLNVKGYIKWGKENKEQDNGK